MPAPTTIGAGLMGYPTTVDTGQVVPQILIGDNVDINSGSSSGLTAGTAYACPVTVYASMTITTMICQMTGSPTGNIDMGIFDSTGASGAPGSLLAHTGAIAATTGLFSKALTANLALTPGVYWLAWVDTVGDSVMHASPANSGVIAAKRSVNTNLTSLSSATGGWTDTANRVNLTALISGNYA